MPALLAELIFCLTLGAATVAATLALEWPCGRAARTGTIINRFAVGFLVGVLDPPLAFWLSGLLLALVLGLAEGVSSRRWAPLLGLGVMSGGVLGLLTGI